MDVVLGFFFPVANNSLTFYFPLLSNIDMHELRLIHTDLKPENILLVSSEYIKVPSSKVPHLIQYLENV